MDNSFKISEAISVGWKTTLDNLSSVIGIVLMYAGLIMIPSVFSLVYRDNVLILYLCTVVSFVLSVVLTPGFISAGLKLYNGEKVNVNTLFTGVKYFTNYFLSTVCYSAIVFIGTFLLIIPGIIWSIQFGYYSYLIVDKNMRPIEALETSSNITQGKKWQLFCFSLLLFLINLAGYLCIFVGWLITVPISLFATIFVYKHLVAGIENEESQVQEV